jgi:hypothetical protein
MCKVSITQWVDPVVRKQIAQIALDEDRDQYELVNEALNLLFGSNPAKVPNAT